MYFQEVIIPRENLSSLKQSIMKLSIKEKVEVRISLLQRNDEAIDEFYERCVDAQYVISDNAKDGAFDREVLLHFLFGLVPTIRADVLNANRSSLEDFIDEARVQHSKAKPDIIPCDLKIKVEDEDYFESLDQNDAQQDEEMGYDDNEQEVKIEDVSLNELKNEAIAENDLEDVKDLPKKDAKNHPCPECTKKYTSKLKLKKHMSNKHPKTKVVKEKKPVSELQCDHCPAEFASVDLKKEHIEKIHDPISKTCGYCQEEFENYNTLAAHLCYRHCQVNEMGNLMCIICSSFQRKLKKQIKYHILGVHLKCPNQICSLCNKAFDRLGSLKAHVRTIHEDLSPYQCDKCEKAFKSGPALRNHYIVYHEEQKKLKCTYEGCDKTFPNSVRLTSHLYSHARESIVCDLCGKSFADKKCLSTHLKYTHIPEDEKEKMKVKCPEPDCNYAHFRKEKVDMHHRRIHLKVKRHYCQHCGDGFFLKYKLEEHINGTHLGLKPYKCELCGFCTAYRNVHNEHKKVAHGNQRYDCPYCQHTARYKGNLTKHLRSVHKRDK